MPFEQIKKPEASPTTEEMLAARRKKLASEVDNLEEFIRKTQGARTLGDVDKKFPEARINVRPSHLSEFIFELVIQDKENQATSYFIKGKAIGDEQQPEKAMIDLGNLELSVKEIEKKPKECREIQRFYDVKNRRFSREKEITTFPKDPEKKNYSKMAEKDARGRVMYQYEKGYPKKNIFSETWINEEGKVINRTNNFSLLGKDEKKMAIDLKMGGFLGGEEVVWGVATIDGKKIYNIVDFLAAKLQAEKSIDQRKKEGIGIEELR